MSRLSKSLMIFTGWIVTRCSFADTQVDELLALLKMPVAEYKADDRPYRIGIVIKKNQYEVSWQIQPIYKITNLEEKQYRQPLGLEEMTVSAGSGLILQTRRIKSSGSSQFDQKVQDALTQAKLDKIPMVDQNMSYRLVHSFTKEGPL